MPRVTTPRPTAQEPFKTRAKVAMARREITVSEMARKLGCSRVTASQAINRGLHEPTRRKIAAFLNIAA